MISSYSYVIVLYNFFSLIFLSSLNSLFFVCIRNLFVVMLKRYLLTIISIDFFFFFSPNHCRFFMNELFFFFSSYLLREIFFFLISSKKFLCSHFLWWKWSKRLSYSFWISSKLLRGQGATFLLLIKWKPNFSSRDNFYT